MSEHHSHHSENMTSENNKVENTKLQNHESHENRTHNSGKDNQYNSSRHTPMKTKDHQGHKGNNQHKNHHEMMVKDFRFRFIVSVILSGPVLFFSPLIQDFFGFQLVFSGFEYILLLISSIIYIYGGWPFFVGSRDEITKSTPGMMTLVTLAISVSFLYSSAVVLFLPEGNFFFWELVTLIDIMLLGHWIEMRSVMGASIALKELAKLIPSEAHRVIGAEDIDELEDIPTEELNSGDIILVKPGERIPTDGKIVKGITSINESAITGESKPISKSVEDSVIGGSVNGEGSIRVLINKIGKDTYLQQVMTLVEEAQQTRSRAQDLANRAAFYLTLIAIVAGTSTFILWISLGESTFFALERMVTVMVITCPHALGLAVPLVVSRSTSISAKNGVLIRDRQAFERSRNLNKIVFDKTGSLTTGKFGVSDILNFSEYSDTEILKMIASLEVDSEHSIAEGIVKYAKTMEGMTFYEITGFSAIPGRGVRGTLENKEYKVVSPAYLDEENINYDKERIAPLHAVGKTVVFLIQERIVLGALAISDIIRDDAKNAIVGFKKLGIEPIMLTGDNTAVAAHVGKEIGIDLFYAGVLPNEKASKIKEIQADGSVVAMVGDGINDAPALVTADVGYAIGAGTDVAIESADIILVKDNPHDILYALKLSKNTYRKMQENLVWATGYNAVALPLAAGIFYGLGILLSPALGAALMSLSTVIVALNARRLNLK